MHWSRPLRACLLTLTFPVPRHVLSSLFSSLPGVGALLEAPFPVSQATGPASVGGKPWVPSSFGHPAPPPSRGARVGTD